MNISFLFLWILILKGRSSAIDNEEVSELKLKKTSAKSVEINNIMLQVIEKSFYGSIQYFT